MFHALYEELKTWGWDGQKIAAFVVATFALCLSGFSLWKQRDRYKAELIVLLPKPGEATHTLVVINSGNKAFTIRRVYLRQTEYLFDRLRHIFHMVWPVSVRSLYDLAHRAEPERLDVGEIKRIPIAIDVETTWAWTLNVQLHSHRVFHISIPENPSVEDDFREFLTDLVQSRLLYLRYQERALLFPFQQATFRFYKVTPTVKRFPWPMSGLTLWIQRDVYADLNIGNAVSGARGATEPTSDSAQVRRYREFANALSDFFEVERIEDPDLHLEAINKNVKHGNHRLVYTSEAMRIAEYPSVIHEWYVKYQVPRGFSDDPRR